MAEEGQTLAVEEKKPSPPALKNIMFDNGIVPRDYDDVMRLAGITHASGLAPKSLDTAQKVAVAMMMAMEVGMPIVTGIQNIAVINGKAGIWGDAALAMVRRSGLLEVFTEWSEGERKTPGWTFYCKIKRKGQAEVIGSYSWAEAAEAGFTNPKMKDGRNDPYSPWTRFTSRMMQFKARNFVLRDQFGDVLRGMALAEDMQDAIELEPTADGRTYSVPDITATFDITEEERIEAIAAEFDAMEWSDDANAFVKVLAGHYKRSETEVKADAMKDLAGFETGINNWIAAEDKKRSPKRASSDEGSLPDEKKEEKSIRAEFINLRKPGFSTWFFKNKDRLAEASPDILAEAETKWKGFYTQPWPFMSQSNKPEDPQEDKPADKDPDPDSFVYEVEEYRDIIGDDDVNGILRIFGEVEDGVAAKVEEKYRESVLLNLKAQADLKNS